MSLFPCSPNLEKTDGQIPKSLRNKQHLLDPMGIDLLFGAVCCLLLVLQQGGTLWPWNSAKIIGLLAGLSILSIAFGFVQRRLDERATIPVRILRDRTVLSESLLVALSSSSNCVVSLSSCQFSCMVQSLIQTTEIILSFVSLPSRSRFLGHTKQSPMSGAGSIRTPLFHSSFAYRASAVHQFGDVTANMNRISHNYYVC